MRLHKFLLMSLLLGVIFPYSAMAKVVNVAPTIRFSGVVNGKVPSGNGVLIINNLLKKSTEADTIRGYFTTVTEGQYEVSEADAQFSNGMRAGGKISVSIQVLDKKQGNETIVYAVEGGFVRRTQNDDSEILNGAFCLTRTVRATEGVFAMDVAPFEMKSVYRSTGRYHAFKVNGSDSQHPQGYGTFLTLPSANFSNEDAAWEVLSGDFDGNSVTNATLSFGNGVQYEGKIDYSISEQSSEEVVFSYSMTGGKLLKDGEVLYEGRDTITCSRKVDIKSQSYTTPLLSIVDWQRIDSTRLATAIHWGNYPYGFQKTNLIVQNGTVRRDPYKPACYLLSDSTECVIYDDGMTIEMLDGTFFKSKNGRMVELARPYKEGLLHYVRGGESQVAYYDGSSYVGTLYIYNAQKRLHDIYKQLDLYVKAQSMNDFAVMYVDGVTTLPNGKQEVWENGVTDYQKNKMAGNYDRVMKTVKGEMAKEAAAANQQWEAAKPQLVKEFGEYYVNILYNYQLVKGMPLALFERVKELGLPYFYLSFPMSVDKVSGAYVVSMRNRKTGEDQYSRVIKFSIADRIYSISTDF